MFARDLRERGAGVRLAASSPMTRELLADLRARGVFELELVDELPASTPVPPPTVLAPSGDRVIVRIRAHLRARSERLVMQRSARWLRLPRRVTPDILAREIGVHRPMRLAGLGVLQPDDLQERAAILDRLYSRLADGQNISTSSVLELAEEIIESAMLDPGETVRAALVTAPRVDRLTDHVLGLACMATAIGVVLGWTRADLRSMSCAALLCDAGMMLLTVDIRRAARPLTDEETNALHRHTAISAAMLEFCRASGTETALAESVQLAVHQHHEREDGSGYPLRIKSTEIHDLARVLAVADTFGGLLAPRAHRPAVPAFAALREIARYSNAGVLWDQAARALVSLVGVYPPGSLVKLSTGDVGRVVGLAESAPVDRPVVEVRRGPAGESAGMARLDLSQLGRGEVRVVEVAA